MSSFFDNVTFEYSGTQKAAITRISLSIEHCEFIAVLGGPGSGKSTFLQLLAGILKPTSGTVTMSQQNVGMVFQFPERQFFDENVYKDLSFPLRKEGIPEVEIKNRVRKSLASVDIELESYGVKSPFELSSGEKRRIAIASILVLDPGIIALDDPLVGLDFRGKKVILAELKRIQMETGKAVIIATQETELISDICDRFIILENGAVTGDGGPEMIGKRISRGSIQSLSSILREKGVELGELATIEEAYQKIKNLI